MTMNMERSSIETNFGRVEIFGKPDRCPYCHKSIVPILITGILKDFNLQTIMQCPDHECSKAFIVYYSNSGAFFTYLNTSAGKPQSKPFSDIIARISKSFIEIYNQAYMAEQYGLNEICGTGYRKALEYLIKDYLIQENNELSEKIRKTLLSNCIRDFVKDNNVKTVAKRATWLGNDETHYEKKWEGKNIEDLKKLIDVTLHWIEMDTITKSLEADMPE
jgi:hypothetical protein